MDSCGCPWQIPPYLVVEASVGGNWWRLPLPPTEEVSKYFHGSKVDFHGSKTNSMESKSTSMHFSGSVFTSVDVKFTHVADTIGGSGPLLSVRPRSPLLERLSKAP